MSVLSEKKKKKTSTLGVMQQWISKISEHKRYPDKVDKKNIYKYVYIQVVGLMLITK